MFYGQDINEHIECLQINPVVEQVLYSVKVPEIKQGDVLQVTSEFEITNDFTYNVMIGAKIILADSSKNTNGALIDQANGFNVTPNMHHGVVSKSRTWKAESTYNDKYVNVVIWSLSVNAFSNDKLKIEKGYGHLDVLIN